MINADNFCFGVLNPAIFIGIGIRCPQNYNKKIQGKLFLSVIFLHFGDFRISFIFQ